MKTNAPQSLKFSKLKRRLGLPHWQAVGLLEAVWLFTQVNAPAGDIGRHSDEDIAAGLEWNGDAGTLITALVECGWLDRCDRYRIVVHDWEDHVPKYLKGALSKNGIELATKHVACDDECLENSTEQAAKQSAYPAKQAANASKQPAPILSYPNQTNPNQTNPNQDTPTAADAASVAVPAKTPKPKPTTTHPLFARFWQAYPKRKNKAEAEKAFSKLNPDESTVTAIIAALDWQNRTDDWVKESGRFIPYPASWLNGRRWEDEPTVAPSPVPRLADTASHADPLPESLKAHIRANERRPTAPTEAAA